MRDTLGFCLKVNLPETPLNASQCLTSSSPVSPVLPQHFLIGLMFRDREKQEKQLWCTNEEKPELQVEVHRWAHTSWKASRMKGKNGSGEKRNKRKSVSETPWCMQTSTKTGIITHTQRNTSVYSHLGLNRVISGMKNNQETVEWKD